MTTTASRSALAAAALVGVQVGACIAGSRAVVHDLGPLSLTFLRYAIALATLLPFLGGALSHWKRLGARDALLAAALGSAQFGLLIALLNLGLAHIDAGLGALLFATFPLITMALAVPLGRERFDAALAAGVLLSIAGVAVALGVRPPTLPARDLAIGAGCVLASAFTGALCSVLYRPLLDRHAMLPMGAFAMAVAVAVLAPAAWAEGLAARAAGLSAVQWAITAAVGASSGIGYWLWLWALKHAPPTQATAFLALSPPTAALLGALALGEGVSAGLAAGIACIAAGLAVVSTRRVRAAVRAA